MSEPEDESFIDKRENFQKTSPVTNQIQITDKSTQRMPKIGIK